MRKFCFRKILGDGAPHVFLKAGANIGLCVMKFFQYFGNCIGKVIRILQEAGKALDPGRRGVLLLGVLRKEKEEYVGNNIFIQQIFKCSLFFRDGIESIELVLKKIDDLGGQSDLERGV